MFVTQVREDLREIPELQELPELQDFLEMRDRWVPLVRLEFLVSLVYLDRQKSVAQDHLDHLDHLETEDSLVGLVFWVHEVRTKWLVNKFSKILKSLSNRLYVSDCSSCFAGVASLSKTGPWLSEIRCVGLISSRRDWVHSTRQQTSRQSGCVVLSQQVGRDVQERLALLDDDRHQTTEQRHRRRQQQQQQQQQQHRVRVMDL